VLVATDIAARGVHVDDVELVVHIDPPAEHKAYLHRSGRTARAGRAGDVVTVVLPEQRRDTQALLRKAGINVAPQQVSANSAEVQALVGEVAPYQAPAAVPAAAPQRRSPAQGRPPRGGQSGGGGQRNGGQRNGGQRSGAQHNGSQHGGGQPGRRRSSRPSSAVGTK
jgi:superfamily II DNA/RNA helicase